MLPHAFTAPVASRMTTARRNQRLLDPGTLVAIATLVQVPTEPSITLARSIASLAAARADVNRPGWRIGIDEDRAPDRNV